MSVVDEASDLASTTGRFSTTLILETPDQEPTAMQTAWRGLRRLVENVWSVTQFSSSSVTEYAEELMLEETRRGLVAMATLSFLTQFASAVLYMNMSLDSSFIYTHGLLAMLSLHIILSSKYVHELNSLHMLGTILLVITGVAIMAVAHRTGSVHSGLMTSVVLLFMIMPLTPWGLREAFIVVGLTYVTFTVSSLSVAGRFDTGTLWNLQYLILASAAIATLTVMRNAAVRRNDIKARYQLERAQRELQLISTRDPLTGAWNRRYLDQNFVRIARDARSEGKGLHLAVLDVDDFKQLNDTHGHHHGDEILRRLVQILVGNLSGAAHVLRLGGDEFAVLDTSSDFRNSIDRCLHHLETDPRLLEIGGAPVRVSRGFSLVKPDETADLDTLYRRADEQLYQQKERRKARS